MSGLSLATGLSGKALRSAAGAYRRFAQGQSLGYRALATDPPRLF